MQNGCRKSLCYMAARGTKAYSCWRDKFFTSISHHTRPTTWRAYRSLLFPRVQCLLSIILSGLPTPVNDGPGPWLPYLHRTEMTEGRQNLALGVIDPGAAGHIETTGGQLVGTRRDERTPPGACLAWPLRYIPAGIDWIAWGNEKKITGCNGRDLACARGLQNETLSVILDLLHPLPLTPKPLSWTERNWPLRY